MRKRVHNWKTDARAGVLAGPSDESHIHESLPPASVLLKERTIVPLIQRKVRVMCTTGPLKDPSHRSDEKIEHQSLQVRLQILKAENALLSARLLQSEARFRELLEGAPDAVLEVGEDGLIVLANAAATHLFGYAREELIGQEVEMLLAVPAREMHRHHRAMYAEHPRMRRMGSGPELSSRRKDGTIFPAEISLIPVWSHEKPGVIAIVHDISKRKRIEEKLRQAQKLEALGRLAGGTAHEFNNLLAVILGSAELILTAVDQDMSSEHLNRIIRAAQKAGGLSRQLLTFGRKQILSAEMLDLNSIVSDVLPHLTELLGEGIELEFIPAYTPAWIRADRLHMEQVIANLLSNSRNAMPSGGKVSLKVSALELTRDNPRLNPGLALGQYSILSVVDTGTGMTADVKSHLFEPFFSTKGITEATGMGLATAYGIITQSGGTISVDSQVGVGTTFNIFLPTPDSESLTGFLAQHPARDAMHGDETILLLEDQPDLLLLTGEFLRQCGYRVLSAGRPEDALRIAQKVMIDIDLLITDILMPGMDGKELAKQCKAIRPGLPVLYVSGHAADILDHLEAGESFLPKPFPTEELGLKIRAILSPPKPQSSSAS
jgi:PAS domain S-box-containing protein